MKRLVQVLVRLSLAGTLLFLPLIQALADSNDAFQFFQEEANEVTASRIAQPQNTAPATTYVVTSEDIKASGAQNIPDALRGVPGVDVVETRTDQAEVSIRGLDKPLNNRTLVLLDGKTVMDELFDTVTWESIPVTMQEIDHIEVVEGPASALYGGNAINGVINIITKTPDQMSGGQMSYTGGERNTQIGSFDYGRTQDNLSYKMGAGWNSANQFAQADQFASQAGKFNAFVGYHPSADSEWSASGGVSNLDTQLTEGPVGDFFEQGLVSSAQMDYRYQNTKARVFWNHDHLNLNQISTYGNANVDSDMVDAQLEQSAKLPFNNEVSFGASGRQNSVRSVLLGSGLLTEDLWSLFAEDKWDLAEHWSLTTSGRVDRHPYTPVMFSPRGSLVYAPVKEQVFRLSAGNSFRDPTLLENSITAIFTTPNVNTPFPNPPFSTIQTLGEGNRNLDPERMTTVEVSHSGQFGPIQTSLTGFHYQLAQMITPSPSEILNLTPPTANLTSSYVNSGDISAWGSETGLNARWSSWFSSYANYSYQYLYDSTSVQLLSLQSPRHKANLGLRAQRNGATADLQAHWVDKTKWAEVLSPATSSDMAPVAAYWSLNAHLGYAFSGAWQGWEVGVGASNLLNHAHYELLPSVSAAQPGQYGEIVRSRWTGTVSYKFR